MVKKRPTRDKRKLVYLLGVALLVVILAGFLWQHYHRPKVQLLTTSQKGNASAKTVHGQAITNPDPSVPGGSTGGTDGTTSTSTLLAPSGTFVSNHHPNLSGSPAPNEVNSVCNTIVGATCTIQFTKDGITKALPPKLADADGVASWNWKLQDVGLTQGSWQIEAIATQGGQIKTSRDPLNLEVQP